VRAGERFDAHSKQHLTGPRAAVGHMPFKGHRTVAEVWADELRQSMMRGGGRR
jgi:hypothetical protein